MATISVLGLPGSTAPAVVESLRSALGGSAEIAAFESAGEVPSEGVLVFVDDAAAPKDGLVGGRGDALAFLAARRAGGEPVVVLHGRKDGARLARRLRDEGLPAAAPLRRVFVASGHSERSHERAARVAEALRLPLVEPEPVEADVPPDGWGPRYAAIARGEQWVAHTHNWHAVEALAERADLILHFEAPRALATDEFPAPNPAARGWRLLFSPWLRRYPVVEAQLLGRELATHAGDAPVLHLRTDDEAEAVLAALEYAPARPTV